MMRDMLDLHPSRDWFLSKGAVRKLVIEEEFGRAVVAVYAGPCEDRYYFSPHNCQIHTPTDRARLVKLMRRTVADQIADFRRHELELLGDASPHCKICGAPIALQSDIHIDHVVPFKCLVDDFVRERATPDLEDRIPPVWISAWQDYHRFHAVLRIACRECNIRRGCAAESCGSGDEEENSNGSA
jgi:5-methylcytosine-specific restriction endonuclease McrA